MTYFCVTHPSTYPATQALIQKVLMPTYIIWFQNSSSFSSLCPQSIHLRVNAPLIPVYKMNYMMIFLESGILCPLGLLCVTKSGESSYSWRNPESHLVTFPAADQFLITHIYVSLCIISLSILGAGAFNISPEICSSEQLCLVPFRKPILWSFICSFIQKLPECTPREWCTELGTDAKEMRD